MENWMETAKIDTRKSRLERVCWPYDKYPEMPELMAGSEITLLDAEGPGVVTNLHAADVVVMDPSLAVSKIVDMEAPKKVLIEITYDHHDTPDISMPFFDFLGDPDGGCEYYRTVYFAKVRVARNFRLPLPFQKHIRIVLKNPTQTDLMSYTDLQWKQLEALPEDVGYLKVCYNTGTMRAPEEVITLADIQSAGTLKAHWLSLGSDDKHAWEGEFVCEANQEFTIDGEERPSIEYLGTEDVYAHSWGLGGVSCDGYSGILRMEHPTDTRTEIAMLRCRTIDSISFEKSLKIVMDYSQEYFAKDSRNPKHKMGVFAPRDRVSFDIDYKSCLYYYGK